MPLEELHNSRVGHTSLTVMNDTGVKYREQCPDGIMRVPFVTTSYLKHKTSKVSLAHYKPS